MSETILLCVFEAVVKTSLGMIPFLAILLLLENAFRKQYSAIWKYSLCFLVLLRLLIPVYTGKDKDLNIDSLVPKMEVTKIQTVKKPEKETQKKPEKIETYIIPDIPDITPLFMTKISSLPNLSRQSFFSPLKKTLAFVWLFVILAKLFYLMVQYILFYQKVMRWRMSPCQKNTLEIYHVICKEMNLKKVPPLFVCHAIASPMCFGFFQKGIYLLKEELPEQKMKLIIKHELCHYQRKDLNYQFLCVVVSTLHFFNPFVLAFVKMAERNIELSCDTIVMKNGSDEKRKLYSTMLWEMIKNSNTVLSNHFAKEGKYMKKRFENILDTAPKKKGTSLLCLFGILYLLSYGFNIFAPEQQLTLLFYFFNLFALFTFCFVMQIKEKRKIRFCTMLLLCLSVNGLLLGCSQNDKIENSPEQKRYSQQEVENLFQWKTDYVGDNSAVGNLLSELGTPEGIKQNGFEIQSNVEPYGIVVYYEIEDGKAEEKRNMIYKNTIILFSLIGNLEYVNYSISQKDKEEITFSFTREGMISEGAIVLMDDILEGYTDSADSYRYFLESIEKTEQNTKEEWQTEIENDLDKIVNNKQVALHSDTQKYIDSSRESYDKIVEKGEQALYYLLEEFEKGNAEGLRGEIIKNICQEILKEYVGKTPNTSPPIEAQEWYEDYKNNYHGVYPYYSSIAENIAMGDSILMSNIKEVLTEMEKQYQSKELTMMSLLIFSPPNGLQHQYHDVIKTNYYVKVNCHFFTMLEQNRGKILYLTGNHIIPVKISFEQKEDVITLKEVRLKGNESFEIFCAEDDKIANWITETSDFPSFLDNLEQELKDYVSKNEIKVDYYCIDGKTIMPF